MSWFFFFPSIV